MKQSYMVRALIVKAREFHYGIVDCNEVESRTTRAFIPCNNFRFDLKAGGGEILSGFYGLDQPKGGDTEAPGGG